MTLPNLLPSKTLKICRILCIYGISVLTAVFFPADLPAQEQNAPVTSSRCNVFTFDATGSHDPDNEDIEYFWDFGDGTTSSEPVVTHTYEESGDYTVRLSITDTSGVQNSTAQSTQQVRVNIPPEAMFSAQTHVCADEAVNFDGSQSYDDTQRDPEYIWNFGDGTHETGSAEVTKSYAKAGDYRVTLTVDDLSGSVCNTDTAVKTIHVNEAPVADIGEDVILKCVDGNEDLAVSFDASGTTDANNDDLSYIWEFGDGTRGQGVRVTHLYPDIKTYEAKLIVNDNSGLSCSTGVDFASVRINRAPKAEAGEDVYACSGETVEFDGSDSFVHKKGTATFNWFFGDGQSAQGIKSTHSYQKPGIYRASLSVENELNPMCPPSRDTRTVHVNSPPEVKIQTEDAVCLGTTVEFDASSAADPDGDELEYYWSFGDGTILRGGNKVSHTYEQGGAYRATVIVDDGLQTSCSTATAIAQIRVNTAPVADAGPNNACCLGEEAQFDATGSFDPDNDRLTYTWDFGDGTSASGPVVTHVYSRNGSFDVKLTVDDNSETACSTSTAGFTAQINARPVPVIKIR